MDTYHRPCNDNELNDKNTTNKAAAYSVAESNSTLLPAFLNQSRNSHLPTPQSPSSSQLNNYINHSQESPDSRYFTSSRPGSAQPPYTPGPNFPSISSSGLKRHDQIASSSSSRLVVSEPRHRMLPSYSNNAVFTPSPELSVARLPSSDTPATPTPKPATTGPLTAVERTYPHIHLHSPGLSSVYQSSPEHHQSTTEPRNGRRQRRRQRTMSIDEPSTPVLNFNLSLARHASGVIQQPGKPDTHHGFDPDDPFIDRDNLSVGGSDSRAHQDVVNRYRKTDRDEKHHDITIQGRSPNTHITHESKTASNQYIHPLSEQQPRYAETPVVESTFSPPPLSSSDHRYPSPKRPTTPQTQTREQTPHHLLRTGTESPLTSCPATPPPRTGYDGSRPHLRAPSPSSQYLAEQSTLGRSIPYNQPSIRRTPSPPYTHPRLSPSSELLSKSCTPLALERVDSAAEPRGELSRIRALRTRLEDERAAACEPHRPDYLVRVQRDKTELKERDTAMPFQSHSHGVGNQYVSDTERVTPVKRREVNGGGGGSIIETTKRKRARLEESSPSGVQDEDSQSGSGLGIIVTPTRGRRLTLFQPQPRMQNAGVDLRAIGARAAEGSREKEDPHTPPPLSSLYPISPSPPRRGTNAAQSTPPPYSLAIRSIDWHTPRSSRAHTGLSDSSVSSFTFVDEHNNNEQGELEERRRAVKERRMAAFRATAPSGRGERLRTVELVDRGRVIIKHGHEDAIGDLEQVKVIEDVPPSDVISQQGVEPPTTSSLVSDWPENLHPWSTAGQKRVEKIEKDRQRRLAYIERYLDRESESESEEDTSMLFGHHGSGMNLMLMYEILAKMTGTGSDEKKGTRQGRKKDRSASPEWKERHVLRGGRGKMVTLSGVSEHVIEREATLSPTKGRKSAGARGNRNTAKKPSSARRTTTTTTMSDSTTATTTTHASGVSTRRIIFPTSTADARLALLSQKRVRLLAEKLRQREEEGVVMCICQGADDGRAMVRCDSCRVWYHLVCVDVHDADELGDEWFCFKCVGDDDAEEEEGGQDEDEEEEEGTLAEEEEEEPGVAFALDMRARSLLTNSASNARFDASSKTKKQQQQQQPVTGRSKREADKPKSKARQKRKQQQGQSQSQSQKQQPSHQQQQKRQRVPDFAPAMPESPVRPGVGDQMLFQHQQTFSLQPSPMPPSPVTTRRRRSPGGVSPSRRSSHPNFYLTTPLASSSSPSRHSYSYLDSGFVNQPSSSSSTHNSNNHTNNNRSSSSSRSRSRDRNGNGRNGLFNNNNNNLKETSSSSNAPSTPRRSSTNKPFDPYYSYSLSSSPTKLGPPLYLTPKPSYDDAPFDPTSTPSRGLTFPVPGPVTPTSSARGGGNGGGSGGSGGSGRYGYGYGYGGYGSAGGAAGSSSSNGGLAPPPPIWGTPHTPTNGLGSGRGGSAWSGWGDESPVRRKKPEPPSSTSLSATNAGTASTTMTPFASNHPRRSTLLDSPFIGPSAPSSAGPSSSSSSSSSSFSSTAGAGSGSGMLGSRSTATAAPAPAS